MGDKTLGQVARDAECETRSMAEAQAWDFIAAAVVAAHEARRWKAMETAPKDRYVLLYGPLADGGFYQERCKWWYASKRITLPEGGLWPVTFMSGYGAPTHWTALPAPPTTKEDSDGE